MNTDVLKLNPGCRSCNTQKTKTLKTRRNFTSKEKREIWQQFSPKAPVEPKAPTEPNYDENKEAASVLIHDSENKDLCYSCGATLMTMDDGFPTCSGPECGIIYKDTLDYSPEWRFFGADDKNAADPTRCGNPINPLLKESSFGCKILCGPRASYEMKKIQKWTEWQSMPHKEKALYDEFQFISNMAQNAGISKIFIDDAMIIHKDISEQKMFRGLNRDGIKAASIYIACRMHGSPRTAHEIAEIFCLDRASATSGCSMALTILNNIDRGKSDMAGKELCKTTPVLFVERFCSRLHVNMELTRLTKFIAQKIEREGLIDDNTPHAVAAGIIFFVSEHCRLRLTKVEIKRISGVSEVTINKCFKKLNGHLDHLIPRVILTAYATTTA